MNIKGILKGGEKLVSSIGDAFDKNFTNEEERINAKAKLIQASNDLLLKIASLQSELIRTEATGNKLQRSWRPIVMLCFAFIVIYAFFIQPAFLPNAVPIRKELPDQFWTLLSIGIGGYVIGRSGEKIASVLKK